MRQTSAFTFTDWRVTLGLIAALAVVGLSGCHRYAVIPEELKGKVNRSVSYEQIKTSPSSYRGELVILGGEVLDVKRLQDRTRIEALAAPLSDELVPMTDQLHSQGRFYAFDTGKEIMDPATLEKGTPITVIGKVMGTTKGQIDESTYDYPTIEIRDLTKWDKMERRRWGYAYPYYGGYYWGGIRPYGMYPYY